MKPAHNYSNAIDNEQFLPDWIIRTIDFLNANQLFHKYNLRIPTGASNCTLTASQIVDPNLPISQAKTIINGKTDYYEIPRDEIMAGDLAISTRDNGLHHTMFIQDPNNGDPKVIYSDGSTVGKLKTKNLSSITKDIGPSKFYRKTLPELIVLPKNKQ